MTPVKLSDFAQWDWKGSLMWWFWWKSTYSRCHSKMLSRFPKIIRSFPSLKSSGILRIVGKVKLWAKGKVEPDISLLGLLAITHVGDIGRRLLKVRHIHKLGLQQLLKFGSVVKELQFFILTYSYFLDISPKVWNGLLTCWEEGISPGACRSAVRWPWQPDHLGVHHLHPEAHHLRQKHLLRLSLLCTLLLTEMQMGIMAWSKWENLTSSQGSVTSVVGGEDSDRERLVDGMLSPKPFQSGGSCEKH